jgi:hypothetical protein
MKKIFAFAGILVANDFDADNQFFSLAGRFFERGKMKSKILVLAVVCFLLSCSVNLLAKEMTRPRPARARRRQEAADRAEGQLRRGEDG